MAVRMKTRWHRSRRSKRNIEGSAREKSLDDLASVMGFNIWKIAKELYAHMEQEGFRFAEDAQVVEILTETIAFLITVVDRLLYGQVDEQVRAEFINALAKHLSKTVETNQLDLMGPGDYITPYVETLNARFAEYAECSFSQEEGPGYEFRRFFAEQVARVMAVTDNKWVLEQVMDIEAPNAVTTLRRLARDVLALGRSAQTTTPSAEK